MTNIEKALLSTVHPQIDITLLEEVINATPNTSVATEILCGIYLEPELPQLMWKDKEKNISYQMTSFNKWENQVNYCYMTPKSIGCGYFPKSINAEDINEDNFKALKVDSSIPDVRYLSIFSPTEMERNTASMDMERWLRLTPVDLFEQTLEDAERMMEFSRNSIDEPILVK